jgi:vacuolar-type H+-ATPase subunit I/STV1
MKYTQPTLFSLLLITLLSCTNGTNKEMALELPVMITDEVSSRQANQSSGTIMPETITERKVIKRGELRFQTKNIRETTNFIIVNVGELKGYISSDNVYNSEDRITQRIEIRIAAEYFDDLLLRISDNANKIDFKSVQVQDVTEEYIDIESRLKTKKELENKYIDLLSKATTVTEILSIEKELGTLRSDIESIEGRLKYLKDQISLSTLTVEYYELTSSTLNFSSKIGEAIAMGWKLLLGFLIGLVHLWPFVLIIGIIIFLAIRFNKKRKKSNNAS